MAPSANHEAYTSIIHNVQEEFAKVVTERQAAQQKGQDHLYRDREPLLKRRAELVSGKAQPSSDELKVASRTALTVAYLSIARSWCHRTQTPTSNSLRQGFSSFVCCCIAMCHVPLSHLQQGPCIKPCPQPTPCHTTIYPYHATPDVTVPPTSLGHTPMQGFDASGASGGASGTHAKGVPFFWLNVLCNQDMLAEHISARDKLALEYLQVGRGRGADTGC